MLSPYNSLNYWHPHQNLWDSEVFKKLSSKTYKHDVACILNMYNNFFSEKIFFGRAHIEWIYFHLPWMHSKSRVPWRRDSNTIYFLNFRLGASLIDEINLLCFYLDGDGQNGLITMLLSSLESFIYAFY